MKTTPYLNKDYRDDEIQQMHLYCYANDSMSKGHIRKIVRPVHMETPF
jgi:hypothetical protein